MRRDVVFALGFVWVLADPSGAGAQQVADPNFDAKVERPAYTDHGPTVLFDEAHNNFHTAGGRYKPFAELIGNDGHRVVPNRKPFTPETLKEANVLVIANALGAPLVSDPAVTQSAFTSAECDAVSDWVRAGGSLLLITDHHPFGQASEDLAARFGVTCGRGVSIDPANQEPGYTPATLVFARHNELLGDHPILRGRDESELIDRVVTFSGQSLAGPPDSTPLLKLSETAKDRPAPGQPGAQKTAAGRAQGLALTFGKGRVVVLGEAGMLSAQLGGPRQRAMGMNLPGTNNRQFALNTMHWLTALPAGKPIATAAKPAREPSKPAPVADMPKPTSPAPSLGAAPARPSGRMLSAADIAEESEASIALVKSKHGVGTGFLVRPKVLCTNAHVIDGEFASGLEIRFPSAPAGAQGPHTAEVVYEDTERDLAFLAVETALPPLRSASAYAFRKGEDVTVIGNPGAGDDLVLENAITRGVMSTKAKLEGKSFYQLAIAINPGNSGGPVFDSTGQVVGVATLKMTGQEALAFCVPIEDVQTALAKVMKQSAAERDRVRGRHRLFSAVHALGSAGATYALGIDFRRAAADALPGAGGNLKSTSQRIDAAIIEFNKEYGPLLSAEVEKAQADTSLAPAERESFARLSQMFARFKNGYREPPAKLPDAALRILKADYGRLLVDMCKTLKIDEPPPHLMAAFDGRSAAQRGLFFMIPFEPSRGRK